MIADQVSFQMFVFGEVQDPLPETVKLVEDIVRGQIIEIVRIYLVFHPNASLTTFLRSPVLASSPTSDHPDSYLQKTLSFLFETTEARSID